MSYDQEEIVISGIGGFFPQARNLGEFKDLLFRNEELLDSRWRDGEFGVSNKVGISPDIHLFDNSVFGVHRQQANFMDPMQRLMLERTYEAIVDAGVNISDLRGRRIGVFMGSSIGENDNLFYESVASGFGITGHSRAMLANRISYWLNIKGPSCAFDTNWTSGIQVLQVALDAISKGHCEAAIIGTTNLCLNAEISYHYKEMGLLSPDGSTKPFDENACGYARSDGIVAMYIQRAKDAKRIYASVVKAESRFDGDKENGLTHFDPSCMMDFIDDFYNNCPVKPEDIDYIECNGCGIKQIDEAELAAIDEVICKKRKRPLMIGSIKANTGHAESVASFFDLAKVVIAMETGKIPATINHGKPNKDISALIDGRLEVVTDNRDYDITYAAINTIGLTSNVAHCVIKSHRKKKVKKSEASGELPTLLVLSTRTEEGIVEIFDTLKKAPYDPEYYCLIQDLFSKSINGHLRRGYCILDKNEEISREHEKFEGVGRPIWFVYSGMGSQWTGMGKGLLSLPIFAETIQKCHDTLTPYGIDLLEIITTDDKTIFDNILHSFVGIAAIQIALTDILKAIGVVPNGIIGHSVGELGCAYMDNCVTAEQMMLCAYSRGKASLEAELIQGMMAAIGLSYEKIKDQLPESIEVACHNSASSCTISGPTKDMEVFVKSLQDKGIFARLVNVSNIAYHSRYIKPAAPLLLEKLQNVIPVPVKRSPKWISTSLPESQWDTPLAKTSSAEYHTNNLLSSVLFEEGSKHIPKDAVVIEIAPHGLLQAILKKSMKSGCINIALTHRSSDNPVNFLLSAIGKMHLAGVDVKVQNIYPKIEYPVSKGTTGLAQLVRWEHSDSWRTGTEQKLHNLSSVKDIEISLTSDKFKYLLEHQLDGRIIYNLASYLNAVVNILTVTKNILITHMSFENVRLRNVFEIPLVGNVPFFGSVQRGNGDFEIIMGSEIVMTGRILVRQQNDDFHLTPREFDCCEPLAELSSEDIYTEFEHRGHQYKGDFMKIRDIKVYKEGTRGIYSGNQKWTGFLECLLQQLLFKAGEKYQDIRTPTFIKRINISLPEIPEGKEDVTADYEFSTETLAMKGLQLIGVRTTALPVTENKISYDTQVFVPFEKNNCPSEESMLNACINLATANFTGITNNVSVTEIASKNPSLIEAVKNVASKYTKIQTFIHTTNDPNINITIKTDAILFIYNGEMGKDLMQSVLKSEACCLVRTTKALLNKDIEILCNFIVDEIHYSLVHPALQKHCKYIEVDSNTLTSEDITNGTQPWSRNVKDCLKNQTANEEIYLVSRVVPLEGVCNFSNRLRKDVNYVKLKYIFILDKNCKESMESLTRNNFLSVYKKGALGSYVPMSTEFNESQDNEKELSKYSTEGYTFSCLGINSDNETIGATKANLGNIDYSAVNKNHDRVMGLAKYDKEAHNIVLDPVLQWKIPNSWSMEDGCTIPHAYVIAFRVLVQKGRLAKGMQVLIDSGCSSIGLAAISVALSYNCTVFTTVATDEQKSFLKTTYPQLNEKNIFYHKDSQHDLKILSETNGAGVNLIVNCQVDSKMQSNMRCLSHYGRMVQLGKLDQCINNTIGLGIFLKNTIVSSVLPEDIFDLSNDDKLELHGLIQDGIAGLKITPLCKSVVEHQDVKNILGRIKEVDFIGKIVVKLTKELKMNRLNVDKSREFVCDGNSSYFVCGGSPKIWADVAEWLILRGAKKVLVDSAESGSMPRHIKHRIELLENHFGANVTFVSKENYKGIPDFISDVYSNGPIQGVYVLPGGSNRELKPLISIESTLRTIAPKALFVNFLEAIGGVCENRLDAGFPTFDIQWDDGLEVNEILHGLDDILLFKQGSILAKNDKIGGSQEETSLTKYRRLLLLLPSSPEDVIKNTKKSQAEPELIQLLSNGPTNIREVPPVFIIPGLFSQTIVADFARNLIYPAFCAVMPNKFLTVKEAAQIFAEKIRKLYPSGPYNVIGISTGGILAAEITKILQGFANTQITFIDGAPDSIISSLKEIGEGAGGEVNLLLNVLKIYNVEAQAKLSALPSWDHRLSEALRLQQDLSDDDRKILKESISLLKSNIKELVEYNPSKGTIEGQVYLIRPSGSSKINTCGLEKFVDQAPNLSVFEGDHVSLLSSKLVQKIINRKLIVA